MSFLKDLSHFEVPRRVFYIVTSLVLSSMTPSAQKPLPLTKYSLPLTEYPLPLTKYLGYFRVVHHRGKNRRNSNRIYVCYSPQHHDSLT